MELLDDKYPKEDKIRIVLDNLKVHTSEATRKYLATVSGRFEYKTKYYILESTAALAMRCNHIGGGAPEHQQDCVDSFAKRELLSRRIRLMRY